MYRCAYTPVKIGTYKLSIFVGRGGTDFQDLVAGYDREPSNSIHEFEQLGSKANPNPYTLTVLPGSTSPDSSVAVGNFLSLTTCGVVSTFMITALDAFGNRRPGRDSLSAIMILWDVTRAAPRDPEASPQTAVITDNTDGSYETSYRITRSGSYLLEITFAGVVGAGTPLVLEVQSAPADVSKTYVYGQLRSIVAGSASTLYVQTRDRYGNNIRASPALYPQGTESIEFEICKTFGIRAQDACGGGEIENSVGITIDYSIGPDGQSTSSFTGLPYFGLYQVTYFPFNDGLVSTQVPHCCQAVALTS